MNKIKLWVLGLFAKNLDDLISIFVKLDKQLDAYIASEKAKSQNLRSQANQLVAQAQASEAEIERAERIRGNIDAIVR